MSQESGPAHRALTKHIARCRKRSFLAGAVIAAFTVLVAASFATAPSHDVVSTRTYLDAVYRLLRAEQDELPVSKANANELTSRASHGCRRIVTSRHRSMQAALLNLEVGGALAVVMARPDRAHMASFVRTVSGLRWNDRRMADAVKAYVHKLTAEVRLTQVPNLCADVRAWVQSGFQKVDADSVRFVKKVQTAEAGPEDVPRGTLKRYEEPGDRRLLQRIANAEKELGESQLQALLAAWDRLLKVIGLQ